MDQLQGLQLRCQHSHHVGAHVEVLIHLQHPEVRGRCWAAPQPHQGPDILVQVQRSDLQTVQLRAVEGRCQQCAVKANAMQDKLLQLMQCAPAALRASNNTCCLYCRAASVSWDDQAGRWAAIAAGPHAGAGRVQPATAARKQQGGGDSHERCCLTNFAASGNLLQSCQELCLRNPTCYNLPLLQALLLELWHHDCAQTYPISSLVM